MEIRLIRNGVKDGQTGKKLLLGDVIDVSEKRGKLAIANGYAEDVYAKKVIEPVTEKKATVKKTKAKKGK